MTDDIETGTDADLRIVEDMIGKIQMDFEGEVPLLEIVRFVRGAIEVEKAQRDRQFLTEDQMRAAFFEKAELAISEMESDKPLHIEGPRAVSVTRRFRELLEYGNVYCLTHQHPEDPSWATFEFRFGGYSLPQREPR